MPFCFFFNFFPFVAFSGRTPKSVLANILRLVFKKACDQDLICSLNTSKNISYSIQKSTRHSWKFGKKLAGRWQQIQGSKKRQTELVNKNVWRKRKEKMFKTEFDSCSMWSNTKTVAENHVSSENVYLHSAGRWSWWSR